MRLLDLYSGAGGAGMGYHRAGFEVVGVDIAPQPRYPFAFVQADALDYLRAHGSEFDVVHASPPCQKHVKGLAAVNKGLGRVLDHSDLIGSTRTILEALGVPYVIENVPPAPLIDPIKLCGSSFDLMVRRHRKFESSLPLVGKPCEHWKQSEAKYWTGWRPNGEVKLAKVVQVYGNGGGRELWPEAMGIDWMNNKELTEAIPPAYTEYVGRQILELV